MYITERAHYGNTDLSGRVMIAISLWLIVGLYVVCFFFCLGAGFLRPPGQRAFHYIFTVSFLFTAFHYFALASRFQRTSQYYWPNFATLGGDDQSLFNDTRAVMNDVHGLHLVNSTYLFKKVSYGATVIALGLLSGVSWAMIIYNIFLSWIWIHSYLVFLTSGNWYAWPRLYLQNLAWGYHVFGTITWLVLVSNILSHGRSSAARSARPGLARRYEFIAIWAVVTWFMWNFTITLGIRNGTQASLEFMSNLFGIAFTIADVMFTPLAAWFFCHMSHILDHNTHTIPDRPLDDERDPESSTISPGSDDEHRPETMTATTLRRIFHRQTGQVNSDQRV